MTPDEANAILVTANLCFFRGESLPIAWAVRLGAEGVDVVAEAWATATADAETHELAEHTGHIGIHESLYCDACSLREGAGCPLHCPGCCAVIRERLPVLRLPDVLAALARPRQGVGA